MKASTWLSPTYRYFQKRSYQQWPTLKTRPTTLLESQEPTKRLHYQLHWAKNRKDVDKLLRELDSTKNVGIAFKRPVNTTDYCNILEKLSQTPASHDRDGISTFQQCLYQLNQQLHLSEVAEDPLTAIYAIALLEGEFRDLLSTKTYDLITTTTTMLLTIAVRNHDNGSLKLHINQITSALHGLKLLCGNHTIREKVYGIIAATSLKLCDIIASNPLILKETSAVDVTCAIDSLQAHVLATNSKTGDVDLQKVQAIIHILGDHSVMRLANTFSGSQCAQVLSAFVRMNKCHEGLVQVISERLLQRHVTEQLTADDAAACISALGDLSLETIPIKRLRLACDTHGILPTTGLQVELPILTDLRSSHYEPSWSPSSNWTDNTCHWSVQTLVAHKLLRHVLVTRRVKSKLQISSILQGCALLGYSHPERSSAMHEMMLQFIEDGDIPQTRPLNPTTGIKGIKPNTLTGVGIPSLSSSVGMTASDSWQHKLLEAGCFLQHHTPQLEEAMRSALTHINGGGFLATSNPLPTSEPEALWSDHTVTVFPIQTSIPLSDVQNTFIGSGTPIPDVEAAKSSTDIRRQFTTGTRVWDSETGEVDYMEPDAINRPNSYQPNVIDVGTSEKDELVRDIEQVENKPTRHFERELRQSLDAAFSPMCQLDWNVKVVNNGIDLNCFSMIRFKDSFIPMVVYVSSVEQSATLYSAHSEDPTMNGLRRKNLNKLTSLCNNHLRPLVVHKELWLEHLATEDKRILWLKKQASDLGYSFTSTKPKVTKKTKKKGTATKKK
eukprot:TRINITY_DN16713_c0_g2_i1.p1 TRINITY_DN16713_c0_g2~~TRINITY_DN16713_c0_g2_i1.p1  ORF type:complete len:781 (+),score=116.45 TRINITY_DN16713_c0_g2_i1:50-2392(+)